MHAVTAFPRRGESPIASGPGAELPAPDDQPEEPGDLEIPPVEPSDIEPSDDEPSDIDPGDLEPSDLEPSDLDGSSGDWAADDESNWDVFLPDDDERDPLPEAGDFWLEG